MPSDTESVDINELISNVREDPNLMPEEKEYAFTGVKPNGEVQAYTEITGMMRRLLVYPAFIVQDVRDLQGNRLALNEYDGQTITGVRGQLPVGTLKVQNSSRLTNSPTDIISWRKS